MNNQCAVAIHVLSMIGLWPEYEFTSEKLSSSAGINPVVVRNVTGKLREAGLLQTQQGVPGAKLTRPADEITLLDVYRAVNAPDFVFKLHDQPNPQCPVGSNIQASLTTVLAGAQEAMEAHLAQSTLANVMHDLSRRMG